MQNKDDISRKIQELTLNYPWNIMPTDKGTYAIYLTGSGLSSMYNFRAFDYVAKIPSGCVVVVGST